MTDKYEVMETLKRQADKWEKEAIERSVYKDKISLTLLSCARELREIIQSYKFDKS